MPDVFGASGQFSIDALNAQNQNSLNNAYGPQGFGGQTADYAAAGAAYGRATGGFNGPTAAQSPGSVFDTGTSGIAYLPGGGIDTNNASNIARYYQLMGGGGGGGSVYNPSTYAPSNTQQPSWMSPQSSAAPQSPGGGVDLVARYYQLMGMGGGGYGAQPAALSAQPHMSLGFPGPQTGDNIDPRLEQRPIGVFGNEGTRDWNAISPDQRPDTFYDPQFNDPSWQRDAIARQILMQSAQTARS